MTTDARELSEPNTARAAAGSGCRRRRDSIQTPHPIRREIRATGTQILLYLRATDRNQPSDRDCPKRRSDASRKRRYELVRRAIATLFCAARSVSLMSLHERSLGSSEAGTSKLSACDTDAAQPIELAPAG
jgi:hypothetical protein